MPRKKKVVEEPEPGEVQDEEQGEEEPETLPLPGIGWAALMGQAQPPYAGMPPAAGPAPVVAASERARFETPVGEDVLVTSHEDYARLANFFLALRDRSRYKLAVYDCVNGRRVRQGAVYLGPIEVPANGMIEEAIDAHFGGGDYWWRLMFDGHWASRDNLPGDFQGMATSDFLSLGTSKKPRPLAQQQVEAKKDATEVVKNDAMIDLLKEMVRDSKRSESGAADGLTKIMTVMLTASQQQMAMMQAQAQQQQAFLMQLLAINEKKGSEAREQRDEMLGILMESIKGQATGEKSMGQTLVENLPRILEGMGKIPALSQPSPRHAPAALPAPVPPPAVVAPGQVTAAAPRPVPAPAPAPAEPDYPSDLATECVNSFEAGRNHLDCADRVEQLGTDDNFNDLLDTEPEKVVNFLAMGYKAARKAEAPPQLLNYARQVLAELHRRYPEQDNAAAAPAAPAVPAAPAAPAAPISLVVPAGGQGVSDAPPRPAQG